jgi:hypothetical protein
MKQIPAYAYAVDSLRTWRGYGEATA